MPYRRQTKNFKNYLSRKNSVTIIFVVFIILIGTINSSLIIKPLQSIALSFSLLKNNIDESVIGLFSLLKSKEQLSAENRILNRQYANLSTFCASSIQSLKSNQDELEKSLERKKVSLKNYIGTGYVIAKPPIAPYGTVIIDIGDKNEVKIGDLAIVGEYLIGVVFEVKNDRSTIKLYGEKNENLSLLIGTKKMLFSGQGDGLGTFKTRTANESKILIGENAWLYNAPNYLFGKVISINQSSADQYQDLKIKNPINLFELSSVDIVSN